jgi:hypothetical protein
MRPMSERMWRALLLSGLLALTAGCETGPPPALQGLWSTGPAACAAGVGLEFREDAIAAVYGSERETLFARPRYRETYTRAGLEISVDYELPQGRGMEGRLVLRRGDDGWLRPISHQMRTKLTGAVRAPIGEDRTALALTVRPCAPDAWLAGLRGRGA